MGRKIGNQIELLAIYRRRLMTDMVMIDRTLYPAEKTSRKCVLEKTKPIIQIFILQVELELVFISLFAR